MNTYPLFRTRITNGRLMSALLLVLLLYNLPRILSSPADLLQILLLVVLGLFMDAVAHFLMYHRPVCAVSAAVTALILFTLSPGVPVGAECLALVAALVMGKLIWGGIGKNPLNPAMVGLMLLGFFVPLRQPPFDPTLLLLPAVVLSLPFLFVRPYAGLGLILGMAASLFLRQDLAPQSLLAWGVPFWGCLVMTDPVSTTARPVAGLVIGVVAGFVPMATGNTPAAMPLAILLSNILSFQADRLKLGRLEKRQKTFGRSQKIRFSPDKTAFADLTNESDVDAPAENPGCERILHRIEAHHVTGCGGAAFPTVKKIRAALGATLPDKHLIINAVECDPGLIHDKWLVLHRRDDILGGIALLGTCIPFKTVTIAAKNFYDVKFPEPVRMHRVSDYYPAGAEKLLVKDVLKIELQRDEIPSECGILVLNAQTVISLNDAVRQDRDADVRYITVADLNTLDGTVAKVRLGDSVFYTARRVFPNAVSFYVGGGAMSARLADDAAVIDEKINFIAVGAVKSFREAPCSQCNACAAYCPSSLPVRDIARFIDEGQLEKASALGPGACIACNLCSAVCPAGRDQAKRMKMARSVKKQ